MPLMRCLLLVSLFAVVGCGPGEFDDAMALEQEDDEVDAWGGSEQDLVSGPSLSPEADTYVRGGSYSGRNFGSASTVRADQSSSAPRVGYLRFDLSQLSQPIERARLRLYVTNSSKPGVDFISTSNSWEEKTVTWTTRPAADGGVVASLSNVSDGTYVLVDVTVAAISGGELSLAVVAKSSDGFAFASREARSSRRPLLLLDFADGNDADAGTPSQPQPSCGDGTCDGTETCSACASDCGSCPPAGMSPADACLARTSKTVLNGTYNTRVEIPSPPNNHTVDARGAVSLTTGERALEIGKGALAKEACVIGWTTIGQQSRTLSWRYMHDFITGSALRVYGSDYLVDGLRAENVEDGFDPRGGERFELRNAWMRYIRDDCIENDELREGRVVDSLFDGCYTFFSEQETGSAEGESLIFENVLVRLQAQPGPRGTEDPTVLGHGSLFKKFKYGGRHEPVIKDSIFWLEEDCNGGCEEWPAGTQATNVTLLWTGQGTFPMKVLPGMTLTTDRSVWESAVARWKARHGCTSIDKPCTKLHNPDPY